MFRIAIVEDEDICISLLTEYLKKYEEDTGETFTITVYRDGDGITSTYKAQFDIILMDIQMKFMDGMEAAEEIRKMDSEVIIIFITNMTQYAIRGYQVDALDYMLKPVNYFAFSQKLDKALDKAKNRRSFYVTVAVKGGLQKVDVANLIYIESQRHTLFYHVGKDVLSSRGNMQELEQILESHGFFRSNKGYLVNLKYVDTVQEGCCVIGQEVLPIARARRKEFMEALTKYIGEIRG